MAVTYNGVTLGPSPIITLTREFKKTEDLNVISTIAKITLDGVLISSGGGAGLAGQKDALVSAFTPGGTLGCMIPIPATAYIRINSIAFKPSPNNWTKSILYTIELEYDDGDTIGTSLDSVNEEWTIETVDDKPKYSFGGTSFSGIMHRATHKVSAKGRKSQSKEGWENAKAFCSTATLGTLPSTFTIAGASYNYHIVTSLQKYSGSYSIDENWTIANDTALEDFTVSVKQGAESDIITVDVNGTITGLEGSTNSGLTKTITTTKYDNALAYFGGLNIYSRASAIFATVDASNVAGVKNALVASKLDMTYACNPSAGTITYNYSYNNKPLPFITGALSASITYSYEYPTDVFASITILGRASGPLLQSAGTITATSIGLNIDVTMPRYIGSSPPSSPPGDTVIAAIVAAFLNGYTGGQLAKTQDSVTWNPIEGKYIKNAKWSYVPCPTT